ncbi:hypothetical protein [Proteiniphilum sp. X52]|uniref:hypothetical protein n=1 Tax=Proteiniphilum sp. X52 TaxID=2382159 RepID=UPI000F0A655F|nr:hypothetical protein [Proteiniphilum sp. X52]RNC65330.1 hypothetical protein D7D25_07490 [Proteiniphilum sp. X52]
MKNIHFVFIILVAVIISSCSEEHSNPAYEPGIYKPYKQVISDIYAFTDNKEIDGSSIKITGPAGKMGNIYIVDMEPRVDVLREPTIRFTTILLGKGNTARVVCPTCLDTSMQINVKNDSLFLIPKNLSEVVKFAPYTEMGLAVVSGKEADLHATLQGKLIEGGFFLSTYNIFIKSSTITRGSTDANYLDLDYLKGELKANDTLVYVKKETYFKKP